MALVGSAASPPLRHANSESRLQARRQAGSAVLGMPGLNSCSSAAQCGKQHLESNILAELSILSTKPGEAAIAGNAFAELRRDHAFAEFAAALGGDTKQRHNVELSSLHDRRKSGHGAAPRFPAGRTGNESRTTLPALPEPGRGLVRLGSPQNALRQAKRSRSTSGLCNAQKQGRHQTPGNSSSPLKVGSHAGARPALSASKSAGALAGSPRPRLDNDLEQVLATALSGKPGVHKVSLDQCSGMESEAHFEKLMNLPHGKESKSPLPAKKGCRARVSDSHGDNENNILRKGTGFVHLSSSLEKLGRHHARIVDDHGDNEKKPLRKGTGFVHLSSSSESGKERHAKINDDHGDNENGILRKGTGFVQLSSSSESAKERHAKINDDHGDNENSILRKGTGFIHFNSVPKENASVSFPDVVGDNVNHIQRHGTGFVFLKHVEPRVRIADSHGDNESRLQRKGTGFIDLRDCDHGLLPASPGSCSTRTVDSRCPRMDASGTDVASDECDSADACEEQMSVTELE